MESDRMEWIKDYVENIDKMATVANNAEWALLVDRVDVCREYLEVNLWGGEKMRVRVER